MKFTKETIATLNNFKLINNSIVIQPGNKIYSIRLDTSIFGVAELDIEFPHEVGIFNLNQLISLLTAFNEPEVTFEEKFMTIDGGQSGKVRFMYTDTDMLDQYVAIRQGSTIRYPYQLKPDLPELDVKFDLAWDVLEQAIKVSKILELPNISFRSHGGEVFLTVAKKADDTSNSFTRKVADSKRKIRVDLSVSKLTIMDKDYHVSIHDQHVKFDSVDGKVSYHVGGESV